MAESMVSPSTDHERARLTWVLVPAAVMALGWGWRGYIGGGPFGAMIPGALVSLMLCRDLNYDAASAAAVAAFGAIGIGFGGEMTYGQTLGLLRADETLAWGLTGTTLKGAVWGLLGGATLGLGFIARRLTVWQLAVTLIALVTGMILGIHWINEPRLIYFSNPVDRPRDESWAGMLLGGLLVLASVRMLQPKLAGIPATFAAITALGGAVGFGGGSLWLALQFRLEPDWRWLPYWKFMEFSFGLVLGAALGYSAWRLRRGLAPVAPQSAEGSLPQGSGTQRSRRYVYATSAIVGAVLLWAVFRGWRMTAREIGGALVEWPLAGWTESTLRVVLGFAGMGCVLMMLARRWQSAAWHVAISVAITAAALDWQRDLLPRGNIDWPAAYRDTFVLIVAGISVLFIALWQARRAARLMSLFVFALCMFMGIATMMGLARSEIWWPDGEAIAAAGGSAAWTWRQFRGEIVVHAIFATLFAICCAAAWQAHNGSDTHAVKI